MNPDIVDQFVAFARDHGTAPRDLWARADAMRKAREGLAESLPADATLTVAQVCQHLAALEQAYGQIAAELERSGR